jgi:hypothetical protein
LISGSAALKRSEELSGRSFLDPIQIRSMPPSLKKAWQTDKDKAYLQINSLGPKLDVPQSSGVAKIKAQIFLFQRTASFFSTELAR